MKKILLRFVFGVTICLAAPLFVLAQSSAQGADDRATAFKAVSGPTRESVPGGPLLVGGYALVWLFVFGYVVRMGKRQQKLQADVDRIEQSLRSQQRPGN